MNLSIVIKKGMGDILFGMPIEEVIKKLGEATEVETITNPDDEATTVLRYEEDGVTLFFEGNNPLLTCIDVSNEDCEMFGEKIFDLNEKSIVQLMVKNNFFEQDVENEDWGERRVSFNEANVDFFFEDDELMSVNFGL